MITDDQGAVISEHTYHPFGEVMTTIVSPGQAEETKGFIGERFDSGAGLQYLNARYYDPQLAIFIQPDWWEVNNPGVGTNRYAYSHNDPINKFDPNGNGWLKKVWEGVKSFVSGAAKGASENADLDKTAKVAVGGAVVGATTGAYTGTGAACAASACTAAPIAAPALSGAGALIGGFIGGVVGLVVDLGEAVVGGVAGGIQAVQNSKPKDSGGDSGHSEESEEGNIQNPEVPPEVGIGPFANPEGGVPTDLVNKPVTKGESKTIQGAGDEDGCHTCGTTEAGGKNGTWIGDHQPPKILNPEGLPQELYPQCRACSNS